jgi:hypothetical protein
MTRQANKRATYICTECCCNCVITTSIVPALCVDYDVHEAWPVDWRIESEDETRAREQAEALKYMDFDRPERKA